MSSLTSDEGGLLFLIERQLERQGFVEIPSHGFSMYPFIKEGDVCCFIRCQPETVSPGDVLLCRGPRGSLIGHRFMRTTEADGAVRYILKGDTNQYPDAPLEKKDILVRLDKIRRGQRVISMNSWFRRLWTWAILKVPVVSRASRKIVVSRHIWMHRIRRFRALIR